MLQPTYRICVDDDTTARLQDGRHVVYTRWLLLMFVVGLAEAWQLVMVVFPEDRTHLLS